MPYPLLLAAGLAATAAGTGLQMAGSAQSADAMARARDAFQLQQKKLQSDANMVLQKSQTQASRGTTDATLAAGAAQRGQLTSALQQASVPAMAPLPSNSETGYQVNDPGASAAQAAGNATRTANTEAVNKLGAYDDWSSQQRLDAGEAARNLAPIQSKSMGNERLLPTELEAGSHAGDSLTQWGQIVGALGSVASMGAASGFGAAAPAATAAQAAANMGGWQGGLFSSLASGAVPATATVAAPGAWGSALSGLSSLAKPATSAVNLTGRSWQNNWS